MGIEKLNVTNSIYFYTFLNLYYYNRHSRTKFFHKFQNNTFGLTCAVCDRLWWKNDYEKVSNVDKNLLPTIIPNCESTSSIDVYSTCKVHKKNSNTVNL